MGDGNEGDSKTPRQQRAQVKKDAKIAQSSNLERQRAGVGGKKVRQHYLQTTVLFPAAFLTTC